MDDAAFGHQLREIRHERGMTQQDLADHLGTTKKRISYYESGYREPYLSTIRQMVAVLEVDPARLLRDSESR